MVVQRKEGINVEEIGGVNLKVLMKCLGTLLPATFRVLNPRFNLLSARNTDLSFLFLRLFQIDCKFEVGILSRNC